MRKIKNIILVLLLIAGLSACNKDDATPGVESNASITAIDLRECSCCGGYWIEISGEELRFFEEDLPNNNLNLSNRALPVSVTLRWRLLDESQNCGGELIEVFSISEN